MVTVNNARSLEIQEFCQERKISTLIHFTHNQNLLSILQNGLLGRSILDSHPQEQQPKYNDSLRLDGHREAICLSISFPNYKMFYTYNKDNPQDWVVLLLEPSILWNLDCAFCQENAASHNVVSIPIKTRNQPNSLRQMFSDYGNIYRKDLNIPSQYPTHPQAEVLVFEKIAVQYIYQVHFYDQRAAQQWSKSHKIEHMPAIYYGSQYFRPRWDYQAWRPVTQSIGSKEENISLF